MICYQIHTQYILYFFLRISSHVQQLRTLQQLVFFSAFLSDEFSSLIIIFFMKKIDTTWDLSAPLFFVLKKELKEEQLKFKFLPKVNITNRRVKVYRK